VPPVGSIIIAQLVYHGMMGQSFSKFFGQIPHGGQQMNQGQIYNSLK
jgi:hypothetical protein